MKNKIKEICKAIEKEYGIKILFAIENGSRAWRMSSKDSDYDVRFVYVRPLKDYIQINKLKEVIEITYKDLNVDVVGFDIFKYVKMLSSSNPTAIEWLVSDIVYCGEQNKILKDFVINHFNPKSLYLHYKSMCKTNYLKYLKSGNAATYKKYLYAYRGLVNAKWIFKFGTLPLISFPETLDKMKKELPKEILEKIIGIIKEKKKGDEKDIVRNFKTLDNYIEEFLKEGDVVESKTFVTNQILNEELRRIVLER